MLRTLGRRVLTGGILPLLAFAPLAWVCPAHAVTYTPGAYSYTVPAGVTQVTVKVAGGGGGMGGSDDGNGVAGGRGHVISATLNVTPGQIISGTVGAGGVRGAQGTAAPGGAGAAGTGSGGAGGASGAVNYSGSGGGGGGGSSLALAGTVILKAGGGGGGQGASKNSPSNLAGGNASTFTADANCSASGNGAAGASFSGDGGGGGTGHADGASGGSASGAGTSCRSNNAALFAVAPTAAQGNQASGIIVSNGPAGYVTIDAVLSPSLTKAFSATSIEKGSTVTLTFSLSNPSGATAQTGLAFTDTLPSGLVLASAPASPQCGGTVTGAAGGSTIALSGGSLAAGPSSCTVTATVTTTDAQGAAACPNASTTNGAGNVSGLSSNLGNGVTDQCLAITAPAAAPILSLQKALGGSGRINANDQFVLSGTGPDAPGGVTTTGSGIAVLSEAYSFTATAGSAYTLNEAMAPGSISALSLYTQGVSCSNAGGPTNVSGISALPINITPAASDNINCLITNYPTQNPDGGPGPSPGPTPICNADPVIAGTSFSNGAWVRSGWTTTGNSFSALRASGPGNQTQALTGVTPGALLTLTWNYGNGTTNGTTSTLTASYGPSGAETVYWTATVNSNTGTATGTSAASNGAVCVSGCGSAPNTIANSVQIRLPAGIPKNGTLRFTATGSGGTGSPYIAVDAPLSIQNTGICLAKTSLGTTGTFNFTASGADTTMGGGGTTASITTAAVNTTRYYDASATHVNNQPLLITSPGATANVTIAETPAAGFVLENVSCPGLSPVRTGNSVTIANVPRDTVTTCTFTNRPPIINLSKALGGNRFNPGDNFSVAIRTGGVGGTVVSSPISATTSGSGASIDAGTGTTDDFYTVPGTTYTLTESGTGGANLANYNATLTCTDAAGVTPAGTLPSNEAFDAAVGRAITPTAGANLRCTLTNVPRPKITLQKAMGGAGRLSASDQFVLSGTGTGAPAGVTTTGSGIAVTSPAYSFTGTAGAAYTLNEAMAPGSASALSAYTQGVTCGNAGGPTDVSGITALPIGFTAAAGDNISCVITNYPTTNPGGGPGPDPGPTPICNADPVIGGTDWLNPAWTRTGWNGNFSGLLHFTADSANASVSQNVAGVTPGATVRFTWRYSSPNNGPADQGNPLRIQLLYGGVLYWSAESAPVGSTAGPPSTLSNGATCVSGCEALPTGDLRVVEIRLPTSIPANGTLQIQAQTLMPGTASDDINVRTPISIQNTGICLAKTSLGTTGTFNYTTTGVDTTMGGGGTAASITTAAVNTARYYDASATRTNNQPLLITSPGATANVTISETPATGFVLESVSCPGLSPVRTGNSITIANVPRDTVTTCTFTNRPSVINLSKALNGSRVGAGDQFSVAIRTGGATGPIVSSPVSATSTGSGATIDPGTGTTDDFYTVPGTLYTLTESGTGSTNLANYNAALTCTDATGLTPASSLPSNEPFNPAIGRAVTAATGANLRCVITNSAGTPTITGRVFLDNGIGGGTANDGLLNGGEVPQAGITMRLTNCAATVYATAVTNPVGGYSLAPPAGTASGSALCVEELNASGHASTGASVSGTALPSGTATAVSGTSYTYTRTGAGDRIAFTWNGTGHTSLDFGDVPNSTFATGGAKNGLAGTTVSYGHTFTAGTAGAVRFSIASETATPVITGWSARIFDDPGCTGSLQPGATQLYPPAAGAGAPVATAGQKCIVVQQFIPATATTGANNKIVVQADFDYANAAPALSASYVLEDTTTVGSQALDLKKEVRNVTQGIATFGISNQAKPGETLEYRITYLNNSAAPISSLEVNDTTPSYTSFVSASAGSTPATLTSCTKNTPGNALPAAAVPCANAQTEGGTGPIEWKFVGTVEPGGTGTVLFRVKVD